MNEVFLTGAGVYLPNEPVSNDEMETILGMVTGKPSPYRKIILRANGIKQRYYARNKQGQQTHLNEELAANAVFDLLKNTQMNFSDIEMLSTATTIADTVIPSFASMVHGRLGGNPMEILSASGVCCASMAAFKAAYNALRCGDHQNAIVLGSELASVMMKASRFTTESQLIKQREGVDHSYQYFNADFLRWMLSDGAGAVLLETKPAVDRLSLRVDWVRLASYANQLPACMYLGISNTKNLKIPDTYQSYGTFSEAEEAGLFVIRQDTKLLSDGLKASTGSEVRKLMNEGLIVGENIDHFLPHISSYVFSKLVEEICTESQLNLPKNKWFTNLATKGNTGAASIFIMIEEALNSGLFKPGDRILTMVPESGRFSVSYAHFTCVSGDTKRII